MAATYVSARGAKLAASSRVSIPGDYILEHIKRLPQSLVLSDIEDSGIGCVENESVVDKIEKYICLAIAENKISLAYLSQALEQAQASSNVEEFAGYDDPAGFYQFRQELGKFLSNHIFKAPVDPDHLVVSAGLSATTSLLFHAICDPGHGCLIPAPYFSGFDGDLLGTHSNCSCESKLPFLCIAVGFFHICHFTCN